jgi:predicted branched-subunit amino acid permease
VKIEGRGRGVIGAVILITLGILMILSSSDIYGFDKSWPILFIVIAVSMLVQRLKDVGAWIIGAAGVGFFVMKNFYPEIQNWGKYVFPVLLIALGGYILFRKGRP